MQKILPSDLIHISANSARIELAYAGEDNLLFGERIYRKSASLWLHKSLATLIRIAAENAFSQNLRLVLYDGLRTTTAQSKMLETKAVKDNPGWLEEPRLLSPPGAGAHPRGMAIDVSLESLEGELLDMGTPFDFLSADPSADGNPAHREYKHPDEISKNRAVLDNIMLDAAKECDVDLLLLPQEWWDFRLQPKIYERYAPLSDDDLPSDMKMCD